MTSVADAHFVVHTALPSAGQAKAKPRNRIRPGYDAAQSGDPHLDRWFIGADSRGPNNSVSYGVRKRLRERCRYESDNHSFLNGLITTKVNAFIGTGPKLQVETDDEKLNSRIESEFTAWSRAVNLPQLLRAIARARIVDGEGFFEFVTAAHLHTPVKLFPRCLECDYFHDPWRLENTDPDYADGIKYSPQGFPVTYRRLKSHPGEYYLSKHRRWDHDDLPASGVVQWANLPRPDQRRGTPEIASALILCVALRRFLQSTLDSADVQSKFAGILKSTVAAFAESPAESDDDFMHVPLPTSSGLMTVPEGWDVQTLQNTAAGITGFAEFVEEIQKQIARCLGVPFQEAVGSSKDSNFASARMDGLRFNKLNDILRDDFACRVLDHIFVQWLREARAIPEYFGPVPLTLPHRFAWDRHTPVDEVKAAEAARILHELGLQSDEDYLIANGRDVDAFYASMARQVQRREAAGIPQAWDKPGSTSSTQLDRELVTQ